MENVFEQTRDLISKQLGVSKDKINMDTDIAKDLGADSIDLFELVMALEDNLGIEISEEQVTSLKTVKDVVDLIESTK